MLSHNKVEIRADALRHNFSVCRRHAGGVDVLAMVKGDAYGHGMVDCARIFVQEGAAALGVAEVPEGIALREAGFSLPILVFAGIIPQTVAATLDYELTPIITDVAVVDKLAHEAEKRGRRVKVHIKMDAGMGRQGALPEEMITLVQKVEEASRLTLQGILAHFPMAEERNSDNSYMVLERFNRTIEEIRGCLSTNCHYHIANSGALFYLPDAKFDMVRPGLSLYGCYPDGKEGVESAEGEKLQPAMTFSTRIIQVRRLPEGSGLGYGQTTITTRPTTLAVLPVGYANGYLRRLSNRAQVLIRGRRAPVIGRISMNLTLVDITDIGEVAPGDEAVLLGRQGNQELTADDIAEWMDTISYEVLCLLGKMNERVFIR